LANVSISDVRDTINVSAADIPDAKLQKMIKRAEVTLELELGKEIDRNECASRAKALLANLKAPAEQLTHRSTVLDYSVTPLLAGDKVHVALPN
jgi:hypothetical protein